MKYTNTLLIIALITFSYANTFEFASLAEVSEIQADPYGKSLLETISLSLANKGNVDEVQKLLNDLLFKLNSDQDRDDRLWAKENARLLKKIADLTKEIERLRKKIDSLKATKVKYEKLRDKAASNLKQYNKQKAANLKALAKNKVRRAADHADFIRSQNEHKDVLNAIDAVVKELGHLVGSVSGKGRPTHVKENEEEIRDRLQKSFAQITQDEAEINAFVELATEADQKALKNLINALLNIAANTRKSFNDDKAHEERSLKTYRALKALLKNDVKKLDSMIGQETKNHASYVKKVQELTIKIANTKALKKSREQEKAATIKERNAKERRYLDDKAQRDRERKIIQKLIQIVKTRLANMSKMLKDESHN
jgi:DNA repair exonuclease SbcCD ATPase subunit